MGGIESSSFRKEQGRSSTRPPCTADGCVTGYRVRWRVGGSGCPWIRSRPDPGAVWDRREWATGLLRRSEGPCSASSYHLPWILGGRHLPSGLVGSDDPGHSHPFRPSPPSVGGWSAGLDSGPESHARGVVFPMVVRAHWSGGTGHRVPSVDLPSLSRNSFPSVRERVNTV